MAGSTDFHSAQNGALEVALAQTTLGESVRPDLD